MVKLNKRYLSLVIWVCCLILMSALIGNLTRTGVDTWYTTLNRSPLTPPNYLFGVAWTILYVMIAISGWEIWRPENNNLTLGSVKLSYAGQLILNWSWMPLFFTYHLTGVSLICIGLINVLVLFIIIKTYRTLTLAAWLLIPYFLWLLFATYLNFYIWQYN